MANDLNVVLCIGLGISAVATESRQRQTRRERIKYLAFAALLGALASEAAYADRSGRNWISNTRVTPMLEAKGHRVIKIEADDGDWEGEAVRRGAKFDFHVDPHSGRITKLERNRD